MGLYEADDRELIVLMKEVVEVVETKGVQVRDGRVERSCSIRASAEFASTGQAAAARPADLLPFL